MAVAGQPSGIGFKNKMLNFKVQGYKNIFIPDKSNKDNFGMNDVVDIWVFAKNEAEAIRKARSIIKRKFYRVARVDEHLHPADQWAKFPFDKFKKLFGK